MIKANNRQDIDLVTSPVNGSNNVRLENELSVAKIINLYQNNYNIDVSNYFDNLDAIQIYRCVDSGYRFYFPFSLAGDSELYEQLDCIQNYYSIRTEHYSIDYCFEQGQKVLEIGCGSGFFLTYLKEKGLECTGLEFNENAVKFATSNGLKVLNRDLIGYSQSNLGEYDIVCSFQVLEHIVDVSSFIHACIDSLKTGGKLIIAVPNNNPFLYKYDTYHTLNLPPHHMGLWDESSLGSLSNFFPISLDKVLVEPLQEKDYIYYLQVQITNLRSRIGLLSKLIEFPLIKMRPHRVKNYLQKLICHSLPGRNITAIYTKQ